jgi:hypothetical protein
LDDLLPPTLPDDLADRYAYAYGELTPAVDDPSV